MPSPPQGIAIDFGTSHTVAMLRRGDGRVEPLLFDASPLLPSAVFAAADGGLLVGRDALYSARLAPARLEPHPKRRVDDGTVLLGDRELSIVELFAAVLGRVRRECEQVAGAVPSHVVLTHPAVWGPRRRMVLRDAADRVGFVGPHMIAEPIAAARYYVDGRSTSGSAMLVYDFGGGTLDVSVVTHDGGLAVASMDGHDDLGGVDIDAAIIGHLRRRVGDATAWDELLSPTTAARRRAWRGFVEDVRLAKERLSRASTVDLYVPLVDADLHLTRAELEELAGPMIERGVDVADAVIRDSEVDPSRLSAAFLVGGASRMPLVATALHRRLGIAPTATDQLEQVVARGGLAADSAAGEPPAVDPTAPSFASAIGVNGDPTAASAAATPPDLAADHRGLLLDRLHADLRGLVASRSRRRPRVRERPSVDEDAFEFSWSGEESLLGTARWSNGYRATYIVLAAFFLILALIIDVPGDPIQSGLIERPEWVRWTTLAMVPAIFIVAWIQARAYLFGVQRRMVPWSVHIGSEGVAARDATADFNLLWSNIASVRLEPIRASPTLRAANSAFPYALTGLHVAFRSPTTTSRRPAGWPTGGGLPSRRRDGWVPVCVIGPMSRVDREHLKRAIRTHAGNSGDVNVPPDI